MTTTLDVQSELAPVVVADTLVVTVKPEHIRRGERHTANRCAVAWALWDMGFRDVIVAGSLAHADGRQYWSYELGEWVSRFDAGEPVEPERFVLQAVA